MKNHVTSLLAGILLVAVLLLPVNKLLSADSDAYVNDFGTCLIQAGTSQDSRHPDLIAHQCAQDFNQNRPLHSWHSVSHCYDTYHYSALPEAASLLIYRGCASYF